VPELGAVAAPTLERSMVQSHPRSPALRVVKSTRRQRSARKNEELEAQELLRQMRRLVVPLLPPEREALRHERLALSVNRLVRGLPVAPLRGALALRAIGAPVAAATGRDRVNP
jgi:hypothetical protein